MVNREKIIECLNSKENELKYAMFEYVCRFNLLSDEEISKYVVNIMKEDKNESIEYMNLIYVNLSKEIVKTLVEIYKEGRIKNKESDNIKLIEEILVFQTTILNEIGYNFEDTFLVEENELIFKKIKQFETRDVSRLFELYKNKLENCVNGENEEIDEKLLFTIGEALIQKDEGKLLLKEYFENIINYDREGFIYEYMPFSLRQVSQVLDINNSDIIFQYYICQNEEFSVIEDVASYINRMPNEDIAFCFLKYIQNKIKCKKTDINIDIYLEMMEVVRYIDVDFIYEQLLTVLEKLRR